MRVFFAIICVCAAFSQKLFSQMQVESVKITTTQVGISAISINSIVAKTYNLTYPIYDYSADTLTNQLIFSTRQRGESANSAYLSRGFFAAISSSKDSVKWLNESSLYDLKIAGSALLLSNEVRSVKYNKIFGYDEMRFDSKIIYTVPKFKKGLMYDRNLENVVHCVNLVSGATSWSCNIPKNEDWVDNKALNDSVFIVAAGGLHAISIKSGLLWSFPLVTSIKTNRSFVYSLAKFLTIQKISSVIKTSKEETLVSQIASNILTDANFVYFASKEKLIAVTHAGKMAWEVDLKNYPTSKMFITKTDSSLTLVNFGLATHSNNFVTWGKPFIITVDPANGRIMNQFDLSNIENLADFVKTDNALIFAGKNEILEARFGSKELRSVISLSAHKYGDFVEFINGNDYYILKEGYFVPLNFINDNLIYFRANNNKIYGLEGEELKYEYHFTELYKLDKKYQNRTILHNDEKTLITNSNFELLFTINLADENIIVNNKMYFLANHKIHMIAMSDLK
jgi:hypothetical protein